MHLVRRLASVVCAAIVSSAAVSAQATTPAPTSKAPPKPVTPNAPATRAPVNTQAASSPGTGTQTEDDIYVGTKRTVQGVNTPTTSDRPPVKAGAGVSPNNGGGTARAGGDDDLDDLEVERRTVQGVDRPTTKGPVLKPGGTSPNTGRTSPTAPTPMPSGQPPKKP